MMITLELVLHRRCGGCTPRDCQDSQRERERRLAEVDLALDRYLAAQ